MSKADYQFLFQIISTVSVIISIVYLGYQIRQNTRTMRRTAARDIVKDLSELSKFFLEKPDLASVYLRAASGEGELSAEDSFRFQALLRYVFSNYGLALTYHEDGLIRANSFETYTHSIRELLRIPAIAAWWEAEGSGLFSPEMRSWIEGGE
jgi:hypothetical protein